MENQSYKKPKQMSGKRQHQGMENPSHKKLKQMSGNMKVFDSSQVKFSQSKTTEMGGGPGKVSFTRYNQKKPNISNPSSNPSSNPGSKPSSKPSSSKQSSCMPSRYLRMEDEEINTTSLDTRHYFSPPQSRGRQVRTRIHDEECFQEHDHGSVTRNSFSPPQRRRVRIENQYESDQQEEQQHEADFVQTESYMSDDEQEPQHGGDLAQTQTYMSDDEHEEENIGSTSHVTRKETRALGETRKSRLKKGSLVFEVDEYFGRVVGKDSQGFITKGGCVMRKYAKVDGTTWKKQPDLLKTDIISKTIENSNFGFKCSEMTGAMSSQLGYQHRNYQYRLHLIYKKYETMEEAMTHPPPGIKVSDWVRLCEHFASPKFQKISEKNKKNRSLNLVSPTVGTHSLARTVHMSRGEGKEVTEIQQYHMAHWSKKLNGMINEEAAKIWNDLQAEEATSSSTPAEICLKRLGHLPGHIKGRSASAKQNLETVNLRSEVKALKDENKATNKKVDYLIEEMSKMTQLLQQFQKQGEI